ncbi:flavodoxin family protein [Candidatus Parcubacteria bacterium]|nr:flavodoxin family protein [Candidatus Parcubacteria bacterium]
MKNKQKILFISGSPREGNTNFVLKQVHDLIDNDYKELIFLKDLNISHCKGCLSCHEKPKCIIKDDMEMLYKKMINSDIFVIGSPNYFDNVSGIMKKFMDRCHPFYKQDIIKDKKIILIFVGGGEIEGTEKYLNLSFYGFVKYLKLKLIDSYSFRALELNDIKSKDISNDISKITEKINSL